LSKVIKKNLESAADLLRSQHAEIKADTFLKFLAVLDIFTRYLDLQYTSKHATRSGFNVLNTLVLNDGSMSPTEISKIIHRSKNATCHVVATLENRGLVTTVPANGDRRSIDVHITNKGLALTQKESILARERLGQSAFNMFSEEELKCLNDLLEKIMQHTLALIDKNHPDA
jgi:DNA-binding MarR family transcriptional regulator